MIKGVTLTPLKIMDVPEGNVYQGMKASDPGYAGFGEAYFSTVDKGAVKAWKLHLEMTLNLVVPVGRIAFVIFDDREKTTTRGEFEQIVLSRKNYCRLTVEPGLWFGFKGLADHDNLLMNLSNIEHVPEEGLKKSLTEINYDWSRVK
jgi:dTDP-4-dehydrorhamnose 3,5-epimerase